MDNLFLVLLSGLVLAVLLNISQRREPPTITYVPVEVPRSPKSGCTPLIVMVVALGLLIILLAR